MDPPNPPSSRAATNTKSSSNTIACKFFLAGACAKPECKFSHDANDDQRPTTTRCPFYKKGKQNSCTYGDKCRYDHCNDDNNNALGTIQTTTATARRENSSGGGGGNLATTTMNTKAPSFVPTFGTGGAAYLSQQMQRTSLSGGSQSTSSFAAASSSVVAGGGGGASGAWQNSSVEHLRRSGEEAEEFGGDGGDDWGYEDEYGNWVSFNTGEGEDMADFVAAQLPDDDDLFLGMTASAAICRSINNNNNNNHNNDNNALPVAMDTGQWVNIEDPQSQAFLEQQYQLQQQQQQQQQYHHFQQQQQQQQQQQRQVPRDVNAMFRPLEVGNASDQSYDQQRSFDAQIECSICLERVADESRPFSARRFGLLDKCDHSFCLSCIRGWRDGGVQGKEAGAIATEQTRMCPICRVNSFFITPSAHFPRTPEEKEEILKNYLSKMKQIPCKHYNNGRCPFGTSCFYSHGSGEVDTGVRKTTTAGEELHILTTPTLADYLDVSKKVGGGGSR
ncbi:unnamed protein product [Bathycoccus prasinos]